MKCKNSCRLCDKIRISQAVAFTDGSLVINLPDGNYQDNCKYCIIIAQTIPTTATITAPVVFTIGTDTTEYPFVQCDCSPVTACAVRTRTRYSTVVSTNATSGVFKYLGCLKCSSNNLTSLPAPTTTAGAAESEVQTNE